MRLRRLEFVVIGVTLAFACFMGGFFAARSWSAVNIVSVAAHSEESHNFETVQKPPAASLQEQQDNISAPAPPKQDMTDTPAAEKDSAKQPENSGEPKSGDGKININLASQSELTDLPGIGNVLASRIVDYRRQHGDFGRTEDIRNVSGIGEKRFEAIQDKITVG